MKETRLCYNIHGITVDEFRSEVRSITANAKTDEEVIHFLRSHGADEAEIERIEEVFQVKEEAIEGAVDPLTAAVLVGVATGVVTNVSSSVLVDLWRLYVLTKLEERRGKGVAQPKN